MKNYPHILSKVFREPWAITQSKHVAIADTLEMHTQGQQHAISLFAEDEEEQEDDSYQIFELERGNIAVIKVHGILGKHLSSLETMCGGCSVDDISSRLSVAVKDPRIDAIMLDFKTPGGTVTGIPELARQITSAGESKPVTAFADYECCSAGLWLASQAEDFFVTESSEIGSVGVRILLYDYSRQLEAKGVTVNPIYAGKFKVAGAQFKPLTEEERNLFQGLCDRIYEKFKSAVIKNYPVSDEHLQGQVYDGDQAVELGFASQVVDDKGFALEATAELIG